MRLVRLKVTEPFRGLPRGFELHFGKRDVYSGLSPICFVGLNGSGKSNVLCLLSEIFYLYELYARGLMAKRSPVERRKQSAELGFELEYYLDAHEVLQAFDDVPELNEVLDIPRTEPWDYVVKLTKKKNEECTASFFENQRLNQDFELTAKRMDRVGNLLPQRIVGYSSGANELISNPFIRMDLHYFDRYKASVGEKGVTLTRSEQNDRLFFMDYQSNALVTIANYLFKDQKESFHHLEDALGIEDLHSFSITVQQYRYKGQTFDLPSNLVLELDKLKCCATCYDVNTAGHYTRLDFFVNDECRKAFKANFRTAFELFRTLYSLRLYNAELHGQRVRRKVMGAPMGANLSDLLPTPSGDELVFAIDDIVFRKRGLESLVNYSQLSDGEHQLLHVLGTVILIDMDTHGALFLLDEPETHSNPEWRAKFVTLLNNCIAGEEEIKAIREQEIILTTHSPFVVSDCQPDRVFLFQRNKENPAEVECRSAAEMGFNTFGASVHHITNKLFAYDLFVEAGSCVTLTGPSGSGSSSVSPWYSTRSRASAIRRTAT